MNVCMNTEALKAAAHAAWEEDDEVQAEADFLAALAIDEQDAVTNYDLALLYKYQSRWAESLRYNRRASELNPQDEAAWWNLGIAATAISDWATAAKAWDFFGITMNAATSSAPDLKLGLIPVRVTQGDQVEVLWANRLDPARAQIVGVPMPDCGVRFHDILLIDGAPRGTCELNGQAVPVFDWLEFWQRSDYSTYVIEAILPNALAGNTLDALVVASELTLENWQSDTRTPPHAPQDGQDGVVSEWQAERQIGIAALNDQALADVLDAWQAAHPEVEIVEVYNALDADEDVAEQASKT